MTLTKPAWAPPSWVFGPVWTVLYAIIFISFTFVFFKAWRGEISYFIALPFLLNLIFNFAFTPLQFGVQSNVLGAVDILLVLGTLGWALYIVYPIFPWVILVNIPYLLWVAFATVLQLTITYLNW